MRARRLYVFAIAISIALGITIFLISPLFAPIAPPSQVLQEIREKQHAKAQMEAEEQGKAYALEQALLQRMYQEKSESDKFCQVHGERLIADRVMIGYGLVILPEEYLEASAKQFPNSKKNVLGGCVVQEPSIAYVLYCTRCREAESQWDSAHQVVPRAEKPNEKNFIRIGADEAARHLVKGAKDCFSRLTKEIQTSGVVRLDLFIGRNGNVVYVDWLSGHPLLYAAMDATRCWKYKPFFRDKKLVEVVTEVEIHFSLHTNPPVGTLRPFSRAVQETSKPTKTSEKNPTIF